ncbi:MAG: dockerin type I domain-containing protein, partial [Candidatus Neomarinimicrobiota bacterium]|nr:dockerin type I domain-containing protein [Candidatus Neomarinimicrobiota bacterium]
TPSHGCYSTVGIENHLGNVGLEYTFNNTYPESASTLQDGSALFISNVEYSDFIIGDINGDEVLDILDVVVLINAVLNDGFYEEADMNQDGVLDILDIVLLVNVILE